MDEPDDTDLFGRPEVRPAPAQRVERLGEALKEWLAHRETVSPDAPLFLNARGQRFSRSGVAHVLRETARRANLEPRHAARVTPHVVRHTTAMHLLRSGADITTIAAWLGHAQLNTTHGYVEIDLRMKAAAIAAATPPAGLRRRKYPAPDVVTWLEALRTRASPDYVQRQHQSSTRSDRSSA
jgi:integrase/recombinase XerD